MQDWLKETQREGLICASFFWTIKKNSNISDKTYTTVTQSNVSIDVAFQGYQKQGRSLTSKPYSQFVFINTKAVSNSKVVFYITNNAPTLVKTCRDLLQEVDMRTVNTPYTSVCRG